MAAWTNAPSPLSPSPPPPLSPFVSVPLLPSQKTKKKYKAQVWADLKEGRMDGSRALETLSVLQSEGRVSLTPRSVDLLSIQARPLRSRISPVNPKQLKSIQILKRLKKPSPLCGAPSHECFGPLAPLPG